MLFKFLNTIFVLLNHLNNKDMKAMTERERIEAAIAQLKGYQDKEGKTSVYEIKVGRGKWLRVRATSMMALNEWAQANRIPEWRMVGSMSIGEMLESQSLKVVA